MFTSPMVIASTVATIINIIVGMISLSVHNEC